MPDVRLYEGDAVFNENTADKNHPSHPLDPSSGDAFDAILALDCAYHFNTRETFLRQSFRKLAPGGRIALADICFDPQKRRSLPTWLITSLAKLMPKHNLVSTEGYVALMKEIGFVDVELEDITSDVFPGFVKFLKSRGAAWRVFAWIFQFYANAGAQFVIVSGAVGGPTSSTPVTVDSST